jgi:hypothetical protein
MEECLLTVQQRDDTRWHVCETGLRSLASFGLQEDAIEYARDLACPSSAPTDREVVDMNGRRGPASVEEARGTRGSIAYRRRNKKARDVTGLR